MNGEIIVQWNDGFGHVLERSFDTMKDAGDEAELILRDLREQFPNDGLVVRVLHVMRILTETGVELAKRI